MRYLAIALACAAFAWSATSRAEDVIVVEQDYNIVRQDKDGVQAKDIRQRMYLCRDWMRIDEFSGPSRQPTETYLIDFHKRQIVNLDNESLTKTVESFDQRAERIEQRKKKIRSDLENLPDGPQKQKTAQLYRALLDDMRSFKVQPDAETQPKTVAGVTCTPLRIVDESAPDYRPFNAQLHPDLELPYDSAEVLYLLQIIGGKMKDFLNSNKSQFRRLPMEMSLDLAAGGTLNVKVTSVEKQDREKLDPRLNAVPEGYKEKAVPAPPKPPEKVQPD